MYRFFLRLATVFWVNDQGKVIKSNTPPGQFIFKIKFGVSWLAIKVIAYSMLFV